MKKWSFLMMSILAAALILGCASQSGAQSGGGSASGTATGTALGFGGPVTVTITMENGVITEVIADGPAETPGIGSEALAQLPGRIKAQGSAAVDGVAGASFSSQAVKDAAQAAIDQIQGN
jgi:fumarate reductase flavoprotein subunit